jgi:soluble lytic murein transglycosylase-like protein
MHFDRAAQEGRYVAAKVDAIMNMFQCHDPEIRSAIMDTFDPVLVAIVIGIESDYDTDAVSPKGCRGLMQLTPDKLADWHDKRQNILIGAGYLQQLMRRFNSVELAVAAYNAGPDAIDKYHGVPPFPETVRYVKKARLYSIIVDRAICYETTRMADKNRLLGKGATL